MAQKKAASVLTNQAVQARRPKKLSLKQRNRLIVQYTPFVRSIALKIKKTLSKEIDYHDLVEYGMIGLLESAERYDATMGANFMTFSYYRIRGAIYDGLRHMGWLNRSDYARLRYEERVNSYLGQLTEELPEATQETDANKDKDSLNKEKILSNLAAIYVTTLEGLEHLQVRDEKAIEPDKKLIDNESNRLVRRAMSQLSLEEKQLLDLYYFQELSLEEVGAKMGLSKSWASRLHARVIERMQKLLKKEHEEETMQR